MNINLYFMTQFNFDGFYLLRYLLEVPIINNRFIPIKSYLIYDHISLINNLYHADIEKLAAR